MRPKQIGLRDNADKLVLLLDRYLILNGKTLTSYRHPANVVPTSKEEPIHYIFTKDLPASLDLFPPISLEDQLAAQSYEKAEVALLIQRIKEFCADETTLAIAKSLVTEKYQMVKGPQADINAFQSKNVATMLAILRAEEKRALLPPAVQTFTLRAISEIDEEGKVRKIAIYSKPYDASWKEVQNTLATMTLWQAQNFGYPRGFSLLEGKWTYQKTTGPILDKTHHDLTDTQEYIGMRRMMDGDPSIGVLVWHQITRERCQKAKAQAARERQQRIKEFGGSPQPHEKSPLDVEANDLPELMGDWAFDVNSPDVDPMFEDDDDDLVPL